MHVKEAYTGTYNNCVLRRLVVDLYCDLEERQRQSKEWRGFRKSCDGEFLGDVAGTRVRVEGANAMKEDEAYFVKKAEGWTAGY